MKVQKIKGTHNFIVVYNCLQAMSDSDNCSITSKLSPQSLLNGDIRDVVWETMSGEHI